MKKLFFYLLCITVSALNVSAQPTETADVSKGSAPGKMAFKVFNSPAQEKTDQFDLQGLGATTFTASNTTDGTTNSYKHSLQIVVALIPVNKTVTSNYQLNFYSTNDNIQQAATYLDGTLNIYYPVAVYDDIRTKLEQAFAAKKKVTVKVIQKPNGYREGTLVL